MPRPTIFLIGQCPQCHGLFFDPEELQSLLDETVADAFQVNYSRLTVLNEECMGKQPGSRYRKCPVCQKMMNRVSAGARSGVVTDQCRYHGLWLDSGELKRLFEWRRLGGQLHDKRQDERGESRAVAVAVEAPAIDQPWEVDTYHAPDLSDFLENVFSHICDIIDF